MVGVAVSSIYWPDQPSLVSLVPLWGGLLLITVLCLLIAKGKLRPMMEQIEQGIGK